MTAPAAAALGARAWPFVQKAARIFLPGAAETGKDVAASLALSAVPNALFAGMAGLTAPPGTSLTDRGLIAGENLLGSLAVEFGAQGLASGGMRFAGQRFGRQLTPGGFGETMVRGGIATLVPTVAYGTGLLPQPTAQRVWGDYNDRMMAQQQEEMTRRERQIAQAAQEELMAQLAQGGFGPMRTAYEGMYGGGLG